MQSDGATIGRSLEAATSVVTQAASDSGIQQGVVQQVQEHHLLCCDVRCGNTFGVINHGCIAGPAALSGRDVLMFLLKKLFRSDLFSHAAWSPRSLVSVTRSSS